MGLLQGAVVLIGLLVLGLGVWIIGRYPAYRHHVVPALGVAAVVLGRFFPIASDTEYSVQAHRVRVLGASSLAFDGELAIKSAFLACDGLQATLREVSVRKAPRASRTEKYHELKWRVGGAGQWELRELNPPYVQLGIRYEKVAGGAWGLEVYEAHDGLSVRLPLAGARITVPIVSARLGGRALEMEADGKPFHNWSGPGGVLWLESIGRYPLDIDASSCEEGYLEFVLARAGKGEANRLELVDSPGSLKDPEFGGVRRAAKVMWDREVPIPGSEFKESGAIRQIAGNEFRIDDGLVTVRMTLSTRDWLLSQYRVDPLMSAVAAIAVFWLAQVVTFGWKATGPKTE